MNEPRVVVAPIVRRRAGSSSTDQDLVAVESPLEILLVRDGSAEPARSMGLVMRTPGDDGDLVAGMLFTEQIITAAADVIAIRFEPEVSRAESAAERPATARVTLAGHVQLSAEPSRALDRTSACGMCGRLAMQTLAAVGARSMDEPRIDPAVVSALPHRLRGGQAVFEETGGLHAAALCDLRGDPWIVREDVGRHNAVDKVIGAAVGLGRLPARDSLLAVSGRAAYEIVQKAALAGVAGIVAVGAPTSMAIEAARTVGLTLVGFARDDRFNVYSGEGRVRSE
jgi:FdhD protein